MNKCILHAIHTNTHPSNGLKSSSILCTVENPKRQKRRIKNWKEREMKHFLFDLITEYGVPTAHI